MGSWKLWQFARKWKNKDEVVQDSENGVPDARERVYARWYNFQLLASSRWPEEVRGFLERNGCEINYGDACSLMEVIVGRLGTWGKGEIKLKQKNERNWESDAMNMYERKEEERDWAILVRFQGFLQEQSIWFKKVVSNWLLLVCEFFFLFNLALIPC